MKKLLPLVLLLLALLALCSCLEIGGGSTGSQINYKQSIVLQIAFERFGMTDEIYYYDETTLGSVVNGGRVPPAPPSNRTPKGNYFAGYTYSGILLFDKDMVPSSPESFESAKKIARNGIISLKAVYQPRSFTFRFDAERGQFADGTTDFSYEVVYGNAVPKMPLPSVQGYTFDGWYNAAGVKVSNGASPYLGKLSAGGQYIHELGVALDPYDIGSDTLTFHAVYIPHEHSFTVDLGLPDTENPVYTVHYDGALPDLSVHYQDLGTREIIGWSLAKDGSLPLPEKITGDLTVYAVWQDYKNVDFTLPDGSMHTVKVSRTGNDDFVFPRFDLPGYRFLSWQDSAGEKVESAKFDSLETTYRGAWEAVDYAVKFVCPMGMTVDPMRHIYGRPTQLPLPTLDGYIFSGWYVDDPENCIYHLPADWWEDITLVAKFEARVFTVSLVAEGCQLTETYTTVTYGQSFFVPPPEREGYRFLGWFDAPEGGNPITDATGKSLAPWSSLSETPTFFAVWEEDVA